MSTDSALPDSKAATAVTTGFCAEIAQSETAQGVGERLRVLSRADRSRAGTGPEHNGGSGSRLIRFKDLTGPQWLGGQVFDRANGQSLAKGRKKL